MPQASKPCKQAEPVQTTLQRVPSQEREKPMTTSMYACAKLLIVSMHLIAIKPAGSSRRHALKPNGMYMSRSTTAYARHAQMTDLYTMRCSATRTIARMQTAHPMKCEDVARATRHGADDLIDIRQGVSILHRHTIQPAKISA